MKFEKIGVSLYRRGQTILARVRVNGRPTWRSTGTNEPKDARQWIKKWKEDAWAMKNGFEPKGVVLQRKRVTVGEIIEAYISAGYPQRNMQPKKPKTIRCESYVITPIRQFFKDHTASSLTLGDCDKYKDWRTSGGYVSKHMWRGKPRTFITYGGRRAVDLELTILCNALALAKRRNVITTNPLESRGKYTVSSEVRHCREVAPTPDGLKAAEEFLRQDGKTTVADLICFLAYSGLRVDEALSLTWDDVDWTGQLLNVKREKDGITPWVPFSTALRDLLLDMKSRVTRPMLFPSPFAPAVPLDISAARRRVKQACKATNTGYFTFHSLRSFFVTSARQSGLTDAEIAVLIGDKTGPSIIAETYGAVRPEHLFAQAKKISHKSSNMSPPVPPCFSLSPAEATIAYLLAQPGD